jgi:hypothetical protein
MKKFVIFNKSSTDSIDEGHISLPVSSFNGCCPTSDTVLELYFSTLRYAGINKGVDNFMVSLTINANKHKDVMEAISEEFSTGETINIVVADAEAGTYLHSDITGVTWEFSNSFSFDVGWHGYRGRVKILPKDFIADDGGRPVMIDDSGSDRWVESDTTSKLFASVAIPMGFKATEVIIYGSATSAITVYEADINSKTVTSKGTGNIGTSIDITDVTADLTNYLLIEMAQASGEEVYGGYVTIEID